MSITCPHCDGKGETFVFINTGYDYRGHTSGFRPCPTCKGEQVISESQAKAIADGRAMRDARVSRRETLRDAAKRMGVSPAELSKRERGVET